MSSAFFTLHSDLPREGPGDVESFDWAMSLTRPPRDARILDAGCGPGADIENLLSIAPEGTITAIDGHPPFAEQVRKRFDDNPRVTALTGNMADPGGPFDLIWSAGSLYFLGIEAGLRGWREALVPGGIVAFSDAIWTTDAPSGPPKHLMQEYAAMTNLDGDLAAVTRAGYEVLGYRMLSDTAWEAYYQPMEKRIAALRPNADECLAQTLNEAEFEIDTWRRYRREFGYVLIVARKQ